jgi:enamine deaminase RidA (YjgF/YER057c/UK114 family)
MNVVIRRKLLGMSALAAASASLPPGIARAVDSSSSNLIEGQIMGIERFELTPSIPGIPLISYATVRGDTVYLAGVTANPRGLGDVKDQTRQILARIDELLAQSGTSKSKLLTAQVWLTDMQLFGAHNDVWNEWVDRQNPPVRACVVSPQLWRPGMLVEIMATAAR